jgi:hypothetical protein
MSVQLEDLKPGVVAIDDRGSICVVTEIHPERPAWPVVFVVKASGSAYKGRADTFKAVVGSVDLNAFTGILKEAVEKKVQVQGLDWDPFVPESLKGIKIDDVINVTHGSRVVEAVYKGYNSNRPKYPISYTINGKKWKGSLSAVVGKVA